MVAIAYPKPIAPKAGAPTNNPQQHNNPVGATPLYPEGHKCPAV